MLPTLWQPSALPPNTGGTIGSLATAADAPGLVLAGGSSGRVFLSRDGGATWAQVLDTETPLSAVACLPS
jgi:photosystem II stability/assembly factor-like uncharacterized protein